MSDGVHDHEGLLDNDPALDYILYEEMEKEIKRQAGKGGCLAVLVGLIVLVSLMMSGFGNRAASAVSTDLNLRALIQSGQAYSGCQAQYVQCLS